MMVVIRTPFFHMFFQKGFTIRGYQFPGHLQRALVVTKSLGKLQGSFDLHANTDADFTVSIITWHNMLNQSTQGLKYVQSKYHSYQTSVPVI